MNKNKLLATLSIVVITGCTAQHAGPVCVLSKYHSMDSSINLMSDGFYNFHAEYDMNELKKAYDSYLLSIQLEDIPSIKKYDYQFNYISAFLIDNFYFKDAIYEGNPSEENHEVYLAAANDVNTYSIYVSNLVEAANKTGNKEIIKIVVGDINLKPSSDPEREAELSVIMDEYANKANVLDNHRDDYTVEQLSKMGLELFVEFAPYCQELAGLYDYDSYLEYSYDYSFNRQYTIDDALKLTSNIRKYVASKYEPMDLSGYSEEDQEKIKNSVTESFAQNDMNLGRFMDEYASYMGGSYLDIYKKSFGDSGYYLFSSNPDCYGTAFTAVLNTIDLPLLFFGNEYQTATTVIHEFGHGYSLAVYKPSIDKSLDINETYSQGNEVLFATYLQNNYQEEFVQGVGLYNLHNLYRGLLKCAYAVDVENYLFENYDDLSIDDLYEGVQDIYASYGVSDVRETYWIYPAIASPGYYISYVTSCASALELYNIALTDFNKAKNIYMNLVNQKEMFGEVEAWTKAGFASPFKESTIVDISNFFLVNND